MTRGQNPAGPPLGNLQAPDSYIRLLQSLQAVESRITAIEAKAVSTQPSLARTASTAAVTTIITGGGGGGGSSSTLVEATLTADTTISVAGPAASGDLLIVELTEDATGGWAITWDTTFDSSVTTGINTVAFGVTVCFFYGKASLWYSLPGSPSFR